VTPGWANSKISVNEQHNKSAQKIYSNTNNDNLQTISTTRKTYKPNYLQVDQIPFHFCIEFSTTEIA